MYFPPLPSFSCSSLAIIFHLSRTQAPGSQKTYTTSLGFQRPEPIQEQVWNVSGVHAAYVV